MSPKNPVEPEGDDALGMLDDTPSSDTTGIGLHGGTAQVNVAMPVGADDDDLVDDEVVDGELATAEVVSDLILDTSAVADADTLARIEQEAPAIVIELPAEQLPPQSKADDTTDTGSVEAVADDEATAEEAAPAEAERAATAEIVIDAEDHLGDDTSGSAEGEPVADEPIDDEQIDDEFNSPDAEDEALDAAVAEDALVESATSAIDAEEVEGSAAPADVEQEPEAEAHQGAAPEASDRDPVSDELDAGQVAHLESVVAAAKAQLRDAMAPTTEEQIDADPQPDQTEEESNPVATDDRASVERPVADSTRARTEAPTPKTEVALTSKRLDDLGAAARESADLLTADRLLEPSRVAKPEPEGTWSHLLYTISGGRINVGDSRKARERKQLNARIAAPMAGAARFVPVLSRKGGVGKTTVTALLGMALADARDDRVIAVDANPDRGTLAERVVGAHSKSVRDMVRAQHDIRGFHDISALVARDETRLDVLASDADPRVAEAFSDADYRDVATVAAQYYSLVLTDSGTGIVHAVMGATLDLADQIVIVSGLSVDEARLASETLTWLETNGYGELARAAIVVLNQSTPGAPMVRLGELESHFSTRAAHVLRVPYDPQIAGGGAIDFSSLQPATRQAARQIAATLIEGLRAKAA